MKTFWFLYYKLRLILGIDKPVKVPPYFYKMSAVYKEGMDIDPVKPKVTLKLSDGRTLSCDEVPGAIGYKVNGERTEIIDVK